MKLIGKVVSDKMEKSRLVEITELRRHPIYLKEFKKSRKIMAHDEKNEAKEGDTVEIVPGKPISKNKAWKIAKIISNKEVL